MRSERNNDINDWVCLKTKTFPNGTIWQYDSNGKRRREIYSDGTFRENDANGNIIKTGKIDYIVHKSIMSKASADDIITQYHDNGNIKRTIYPDGQIKEYDNNGIINRAIFPDRSIGDYDAKGKLYRKILLNGIVEQYDKNENLTRSFNLNDITVDEGNGKIKLKI